MVINVDPEVFQALEDALDVDSSVQQYYQFMLGNNECLGVDIYLGEIRMRACPPGSSSSLGMSLTRSDERTICHF